MRKHTHTHTPPRENLYKKCLSVCGLGRGRLARPFLRIDFCGCSFIFARFHPEALWLTYSRQFSGFDPGIRRRDVEESGKGRVWARSSHNAHLLSFPLSICRFFNIHIHIYTHIYIYFLMLHSKNIHLGNVN